MIADPASSVHAIMIVRRIPLHVAAVALILTLAFLRDRVDGTEEGYASSFAWWCAWLCLVGSVAASAAARLRISGGRQDPHHGGFVGAAHLASLLAAAAASVILCILLFSRLLLFVVEMTSGSPVRGSFDLGLSARDLWSLAFLFVAGCASARETARPALRTATFWCGTAAVVWICLLTPTFVISATGSYQRTSASHALMTCLSAVTALASLVCHAFETNSTSRREPAVPASHGLAIPCAWPGFRLSVSVVGVIVSLLVVYHLAVPHPVGVGPFRVGALSTFAAGAVGAWSCLRLASKCRTGYLLDVGMGLASLACCALPTIAVPSSPRALSERYPILFTAMIVGLSMATGTWTLLACRWRERSRHPGSDPFFAELSFRGKRFALLSAALALVMSTMMAIWPRLPAIAASDDSFSRTSAGMAANLSLLLVLLWSARRLRWRPFHIAVVLATFSMVGFLVVRVLPFAQHSI